MPAELNLSSSFPDPTENGPGTVRILNSLSGQSDEKATASAIRLNADELFIERTFSADPQKGFELLFREYYGPLCSHAIRFVYSREVARDLVSDIFCVFWQKAIYKEISTSYRAYLYTAVRNRSLKYLQRELGREHTVPNDTDSEPLTATEFQTPEDIMAYDELLKRVESAIQEFPPQRQRVFLMNRFEGKKYQTIADELHISLKAVEAHISKSLAMLRQVLPRENR